jgi:hypothetical protein
MGPTQSVTEYNVDFQQALTDLAGHVTDEQRFSSNVTVARQIATVSDVILVRPSTELPPFSFPILSQFSDQPCNHLSEAIENESAK